MTQSDGPLYVLRLFVSGTTSRSQRAIANVQHVCEERLEGRYDLQVVDVYQDPEATRDLQVVATPTLVKLEPGPMRRIVGDLSNRSKLLVGLELPENAGKRGAAS